MSLSSFVPGACVRLLPADAAALGVPPSAVGRVLSLGALFDDDVVVEFPGLLGAPAFQCDPAWLVVVPPLPSVSAG